MGKRKTIIHKQCTSCKKIYHIEVNKKDLYAYMNDGKLIQNAFPYLSAGERELIISGICDTCFNDMMKDDEEDEEHQDDADELLSMLYSKDDKPEENMPESYEYNNRD